MNDYPYYKYVKSPSQLGMSSSGSLSALGKDVEGLISYVELLVSGKSPASATGKPLGNKYFLRTGGSCVAQGKGGEGGEGEGEKQDRYIYVDNVPAGNVPFISSGMGVNFSEFRGLIPGAISNLNAFNPDHIFHAFSAGATPACQPLTMETIDIENRASTETHYVTLADIESMDPCSFKDKKNPLTGATCKEAFEQNTAANAPRSLADTAFVVSLLTLFLLVLFAWVRRTYRPNIVIHMNIQLACIILCAVAVIAGNKHAPT